MTLGNVTDPARAGAGGRTGQSSEPGFRADDDFEHFLRLLTTQLRYQDPLQPMEPTQFVAQLANFSAVEQQIGTNRRLDALAMALNARSLGDAAALIGKRVETGADGPSGVAAAVDLSGNAPALRLEDGRTVAFDAVTLVE